MDAAERACAQELLNDWAEECLAGERVLDVAQLRRDVADRARTLGLEFPDWLFRGYST